MAKTNRVARQHYNLEDLFARSKKVESGCIEWQMARSAHGYPKIWLQGRIVIVSRYILTMLVGPPEADMKAMHTCDNPPCINPDHLKWGTHTDNMRDSFAKNRMTRNHGENHHKVKLTESQVREIRSLKGTMTNVNLGKKYGVSRSAISHVLSGKNWKHLE